MFNLEWENAGGIVSRSLAIAKRDWPVYAGVYEEIECVDCIL